MHPIEVEFEAGRAARMAEPERTMVNIGYMPQPFNCLWKNKAGKPVCGNLFRLGRLLNGQVVDFIMDQFVDIAAKVYRFPHGVGQNIVKLEPQKGVKAAQKRAPKQLSRWAKSTSHCVRVREKMVMGE